ncbi:hypothetical protein IFM89_038937 [Coptis chinensis]|uniref:GATA-type domain-containing protein n=1 Tax=Coptis chinensis TaxID=261450 RepID=A0A835I8K4_9MAGN|nr:hypothetical protein IFM89_038937 [Coptis chinensis]
MHRCSSSHGNSFSPCSSCGFYQAAPSNSFSMFFSMPNHQQQQYDEVDAYSFNSSSSVDCTLSLGTPSTRQSNNNFVDHQHSHRSSSSSSGSNKFSWDIFQTKKPSSSSASTHKSSNRGGNNGILNNLNGDPLLARRCANCDTTSTPLWRNGPRGPKSLCNACGIRYKKEERRAATSSTSNSNASTIMDPQHYMGHHHMNSWTHQGNEFRFIDQDTDSDSANNTIPFLSWRLNVPVHDYS